MSEDTLRELNVVKTENIALKKRIKDLEAGFATKIETATLIKSILTDLMRVDEFAMTQERPTTYVISDFNLQLKAVVTQQADKPILILPSKPGEIDPALTSLVNITLKPVPLPIPPIKKPRPVESVEGIGTVLAGRLREAGIHTVVDLALTPPKELIRHGISEKKAAEFTSMAKLMVKGDLSGIEGVDEQAAELLVIAGKIDSKENLAKSNPEELYNTLSKALEERRVRVPKGYQLTLEDVKRWVDSAKRIVSRTGIV